jgi:hypothetical protein
MQVNFSSREVDKCWKVGDRWRNNGESFIVEKKLHLKTNNGMKDTTSVASLQEGVERYLHSRFRLHVVVLEQFTPSERRRQPVGETVY